MRMDNDKLSEGLSRRGEYVPDECPYMHDDAKVCNSGKLDPSYRSDRSPPFEVGDPVDIRLILVHNVI